MRVCVHVVAPAIGDKMEHLRELQWIRTVVDLDDHDQGVRSNDKVAPVTTFVTTHHEQASHAHDERWKGRGRGLRVERRYLVLHLGEG